MRSLRHSALFLLGALAFVSLAACQPKTPDHPSAVNNALSSAGAFMQETDAAADGGIYADYKEGVIGNGQPAMLFFYASWCPTCKKTDETLKSWYGGGVADGMISVYKVDFDKELELRSRYGVTSQHTFVKIDGDGKPSSMMENPNDAELVGFLM